MPMTSDERKLTGGALLVLGGSLGALALALGIRATDHMAAAAALCGPTTGHCLLCFGAVATFVAAFGAGAFATSMLGGVPIVRRGRHQGPPQLPADRPLPTTSAG